MGLTGDEATDLHRSRIKRTIGCVGASIIIDTLTDGEINYPTESVWQVVDKPDHLEHAFAHLEAHRAGRTDEPHLEHAATRCVLEVLRLALASEEREAL